MPEYSVISLLRIFRELASGYEDNLRYADEAEKEFMELFTEREATLKELRLLRTQCAGMQDRVAILESTIRDAAVLLDILAERPCDNEPYFSAVTNMAGKLKLTASPSGRK